MGQCMMVILLLGSTWVFTAQLDYIQGKRLGLQPARVLVGPSSFPTFVDQYPVFRETLEQFPQIESVGTTLMLPGRTGRKGLLATTGTRRTDLPQAENAEHARLGDHRRFRRSIRDGTAGRPESVEFPSGGPGGSRDDQRNRHAAFGDGTPPTRPSIRRS